MSQGAGPGPREDALSRRLASLPLCIGEILIKRGDGSSFAMRHRDDAEAPDLLSAPGADAAAEIARYDDAGIYRPLKTAPNLRHGWQLLLPDVAAVRLALNFFYPGRMAVFLAHDVGELATTPLRETLQRQTGMYRVAARLTDQQADELVGRFCRSEGGCLRTIRWARDATGAPASTLLPATKFDPAFDQTGRRESAIPLLCQEACNLLVAAARDIVKPAVC